MADLDVGNRDARAAIIRLEPRVSAQEVSFCAAQPLRAHFGALDGRRDSPLLPGSSSVC